MLKKGSLVHESEPYAHVLLQKQRGKRCDQCFKEAQTDRGLMRCSACGVVRYCNVTCQRNAWTLHKEECKCLKRVQPKIPTDSVRLMYKLILRWKAGDHERVSEEDRTFKKFMAHEEDIKKDAKRMQEFLMLCQTLSVFVGDQESLPPSSELLSIYGKMVINSFSICDAEMQPIGSGVYLGASQFDHSCVPDAVVTFVGCKMSVRLLHDIDKKKVDSLNKLSISYIDQLATKSERQQQLRDQYYFTCDCCMCMDLDKDTRMRGLLGKEEPGREQMLQDTADPDQEEAWQSLLQQLKRMKAEGDPVSLLEMGQNWLRKNEENLQPDSVYVVRVLDYLADACIDQTMWQRAFEYSQRTVQAYRTFYPAPHPNVGIQFLKLGKLALYLQALDKAEMYLQQAKEVLEVTHGSHHPLLHQLNMFLSQAREEKRHSEVT